LTKKKLDTIFGEKAIFHGKFLGVLISFHSGLGQACGLGFFWYWCGGAGRKFLGFIGTLQPEKLL